MGKITLRRALRVKNTLAGEVSELQKLISEYNNQVEGRVYLLDPKELYTQLWVKLQKLIALKSRLATANAGGSDGVIY